MYEIYCEKVRDLLASGEEKKGGLKIREHPKHGFYGKLFTKVEENLNRRLWKKKLSLH